MPKHLYQINLRRVKYIIETGRKQFAGNGTVAPTIYGEEKIYHLRWSRFDLARSPDEELIKKPSNYFKNLLKTKDLKEQIEMREY